MNNQGHNELGQHFMTDQALLARIAQAGEITAEDVIVEIGSGKGALTTHLLGAHPKKLICIEIDPRLRTPDKKVTYLQADAKEHLHRLHYNKVIANIPYHESEPLLQALLRAQPDLMVLVVGETFAHKLFEETIVGIITRTSYELELLEHIPPSAFAPPPRVQSSLVRARKKEPTQLQRLLLPFYAHQRQKVNNYLLSISKDLKTKKEVKTASQELPADLLEQELYTLNTTSFKRIYTFIKEFYL